MLGIRHALDLLVFTTIGRSFMSASLAFAWLRARERATRAEAYIEGLRSRSSVSQENMAPALDAIAVEVERIGEGQRFLTRALTEQSSQPSRRVGTVTPH